jgi:hypothetical protein
MNAALSRFLLVSAALTAAHEVGDQWVQTHHQACTKGRPGWAGRRACAAHVATYTATGALAALVASRRLNVPLRPAQLAAGLVLNAASHYVADRREPLRKLARLARRSNYLTSVTVVRQKGEEAEDAGPGTALFHLDQSWHYGWIFIAALVAAGSH